MVISTPWSCRRCGGLSIGAVPDDLICGSCAIEMAQTAGASVPWPEPGGHEEAKADDG